MVNLTGQFIIICWAIFLIYWFISAFSVKRTALERGWRSWGWRFPILAAVLLLILLNQGGFSKYVGVILWHSSLLIGLVADLITLAGLIIVLWSRKTLAGNWSSDVVIKENHELIERGPYAYVRHPIYSGLLLMVLGAAIISGRVGAFVVLAILFFGFWFKASQEERLLTKHFPDAYPNYKARVKAFIPFIF